MNPRVAIGVLAALGGDMMGGFGRGAQPYTPPPDPSVFKTGSRGGESTYTRSPYDCNELKRARRKRQRQAKKRGRRAA